MISVDHVSKSFGSLKALQNISFETKRNEVIGFLGPNGAGKTTLMRLLCGILPPSAGSIFIEDQNLLESNSIRRRIGYLAENNPLYQDMTAGEFLKYAAQLKGITRSQRKIEITKVVESCGIQNVLDRVIGKLSKGYQQRIGLAQALLGEPPILILDEPTNGLDPAQMVEFRKLIQSLGKERAVILSTHILQEAEAVSDRVLILNEGQIAAFFDLRSTRESLEATYLKLVTKESK